MISPFCWLQLLLDHTKRNGQHETQDRPQRIRIERKTQECPWVQLCIFFYLINCISKPFVNFICQVFHFLKLFVSLQVQGCMSQ